MLSLDIIPIPTDEAVREVENKLLGVETFTAKREIVNMVLSVTMM